ncbi:MAG: S8 family serine peptidase [Balneolales bacterium]
MPIRRHLKYTGRTVEQGRFSFNPRALDQKTKSGEQNYSSLQQRHRQSLINFNKKRQVRRERRNPDLDLRHIDYIQLNFFDAFNIPKYAQQYRSNFGLVPVSFWNYNQKGLFAIHDPEKFEMFMRDVQGFSESEDPVTQKNYSPYIRFIDFFDGYSREEILETSEPGPVVVLELIRSPELHDDFVDPLNREFQGYLSEKGMSYQFDPQAELITLEDPDRGTILEIADNFDHIQKIASPDSGIIQPSRWRVAIRGFGFSVNTENIEVLPVIGILDTGVSDQTPLKPLLIDAHPGFDLTQTSPHDDEADHGTGVAALAALGRRPYPDYEGEIEADARILSIKILKAGKGQVNQHNMLESIRRAHYEHSVKIFVLTTNWMVSKEDHEKPTHYTYALDMLSKELDILIFISTANGEGGVLDGRGIPITYPNHFLTAAMNLKVPADSMNNMVVGASADDLMINEFDGYSIDRTYPAVYSLKFHLNWEDQSLKKSFKNTLLRKPDILMSGGDYDTAGNADVHGIKVLSAEKGQYFKIMPGTSYAAPLAANLAAKLLRIYPDVKNMQSIKSLIVNSARDISLGPEFNSFKPTQKTAVSGYGRPMNSSVCTLMTIR